MNPVLPTSFLNAFPNGIRVRKSPPRRTTGKGIDLSLAYHPYFHGGRYLANTSQ